MTDMHTAEVEYEAISRNISPEERFTQLREEIPLGRHGKPDDIAGAVSYLASSAGAYVSGHTLSVNGGISLS